MYYRLTNGESLWLKHRVRLVLERAFPSGRVWVDIERDLDWSTMSGLHIRVDVEEAGGRSGCVVNYHPESISEGNQDYVRMLIRDIINLIVYRRSADAWQQLN